jgi:hypothetical protein
MDALQEKKKKRIAELLWKLRGFYFDLTFKDCSGGLRSLRFVIHPDSRLLYPLSLKCRGELSVSYEAKDISR